MVNWTRIVPELLSSCNALIGETMFDEKTVQQLKYYVYALFDPEGNPFYIGKGTGNRVFAHAQGALDETTENLKYETIRSIIASGKSVRHLVIRHGMDEKTSFDVESALIDFAEAAQLRLSNLALGHSSLDCGLMSTDEIIRKYNAEKLVSLPDPVVIININRTYARGSGADGIYEATRKYWVISAERRKKAKYALAEFRGFIAEVYEIDRWYPAEVGAKNRWAFHGSVAPMEIRKHYLNKSIAFSKVQGAANPIRFSVIGVDYLFRKHPPQWGLRGDPQLWNEMKTEIVGHVWPNSATELHATLSGLFEKFTGKHITHKDDIYIERYDTGGMSGGLVSPEFWRETAIPFLIDEFQRRDQK